MENQKIPIITAGIVIPLVIFGVFISTSDFLKEDQTNSQELPVVTTPEQYQQVDLFFEKSFIVDIVTKRNENQTKTKTSIVDYNIKNGNVINMVDLGRSSLYILLITFDDGNLQIKIPRELIDSKTLRPPLGGFDAMFYVINDGTLYDSDDTQTTSTHRVLDINFTKNTKLIQIIGGCHSQDPKCWLSPQ